MTTTFRRQTQRRHSKHNACPLRPSNSISCFVNRWVAMGASAATSVACVILVVLMGLDRSDHPDRTVIHKKIQPMSFAAAFGTICFAFGGHPTFPTFQNDMKEPQKFGSACRLAYLGLFVCWLVGCLTSQQHASVSQGRICSDNFTCCHTEIEVADQTFHLTQSQYTDTGPTSPSTDPITPGAWQGSHWSANL